MSEDRFAEVERLYHEAMARPSAERAAFLDEACGGDDALRQDVESLLSLQTGADEFLSRPAIEEAARTGLRGLEADPWPTIPGYTVIRVLGEGGMGVVYLAWQETPFRRLVALKLIKPGMDTRQVVARFETERQALALMDHPNIAAVFDAGSTAQGRPYFVMEFVEGVSITEYCDRGRLSTGDRLALFVQVCAAVQHAHQKGVIHRDLKPSNVIVAERDGHAVPKVIDFGTAKAMGGVWNATATQVGEGMVIGTLEYMSPEQAALSTDIDTATDVYSLGVLLYELLVGRLPFDTAELRAAGHDEMRRVIRESEPPKPSSRVDQRTDKSGAAARARQTDAPGLTRQLRGDLDWITLKALEKDRKRRYATVAAFATDIGRFLSHQPVDARPPSSAYRIRKFTRRHRLAVAAAVIIVTILGAGVAVTAGLYWEAEASRRETERQRQQATEQREEALAQRNAAEGATTEANIQRLDAERQRVMAAQETQRAIAALDLSDYRNYVITIAAADAELRASRLSQARERLTLVPAAKRGWEWDHLFLRAEPNPILADPSPCPSTAPATATNTLGRDPDGKRIYFSYCGRVSSWNTDTFDYSVVPARTSDLAAAAPSARRVEGFLNLGPDLPPPVENKWKVYVTDSIGVRLLSKLVGPFDRKPLCADLSRDGRLLALGFDPINSITRLESGDFKQVIEPYVFEVWDMEKGRQISRVIPPMPPSADPRAAQPSTPLDAGMKCFVRLSPDTTLLATSTLIVQVWDVATGAPVHVDRVQAGRLPQPIAFSPTTRQLAIGRRNGLIDVLGFANSSWTVTSLDGADVVRPRPLKDDDRRSDVTNRSQEEVRAVEFASDGQTVVSAQAKRVIVWDLQSTRARKLLDVPRSTVTGLVVHEQTVYSSHADGTVTVEALEESTGITRLKGSTSYLGSTARAAISSDDRTIALASEGSLAVWHLDDHRETVVRPAPGDPRGQLFSMIVPLADKRTILTGLPGRVMQWNSETRLAVNLPAIDRMEPDCAAMWEIGRGVVSSVLLSASVSPNDRYLVMALGHCVVVRDLSTAQTMAILRVDRPAGILPLDRGSNPAPYMYFRFLSNESILVTASHRQSSGQPVINSVIRWNWTTRRVSARRSFPTPTMPALPLAASRDGRRVALAEAGFVTVWDGTLALEIGRIPTGNLNGNLLMALNADGTRLALAASGQTSVGIWDTATSQLLLTLTDDDAPQFLAFTPSGELIAVNPSGGLTIWETQRPKCPQCPKIPVPVK